MQKDLQPPLERRGEQRAFPSRWDRHRRLLSVSPETLILTPLAPLSNVSPGPKNEFLGADFTRATECSEKPAGPAIQQREKLFSIRLRTVDKLLRSVGDFPMARTGPDCKG